MPSFPRRLRGGAALALALVTSVHAKAQVIGPPNRASQALAAPLSEAYPADGAGDGITSGGYSQSRWAEDWSKLRDPARRKNFIDHLKFIPVDAAGDIYVTLSGELRLRMNETTNPDLKNAQAQRQDIARIVGGADLHLGPHFRVYAELAHAGISGRNIGVPSGYLDNTAIVQQSFADATAKVAGVKLGVRYGRQTFSDGPNLLLVPRDNNTIFLSYNGVRVWAKARNMRIDAFDFTPTRPGQQGTGDDLNKDTRRFSGISGGLRIPNGWLGGSKLYLDPFYWRLRNTAAVWGPTTAHEVREFYGLHLWGDAGPVNLDWTVNYQGGQYDNREIAAWQVLMAQSYRLGKDRSGPRVGFHADYATGGGPAVLWQQYLLQLSTLCHAHQSDRHRAQFQLSARRKTARLAGISILMARNAWRCGLSRQWHGLCRNGQCGGAQDCRNRPRAGRMDPVALCFRDGPL